MKRGPFKITSSKNVYQNPWISVHEDKIVRPNGEEGLFGIVEYSPGVSTVALDSDNNIFLVEEFAYAIGEYNISLPQGGVEPNESYLNAAKRELREEAGVEASEWKELGYINPYTMIINGPMYLYLAKNAQIVTKHEEEFELITIPFKTAVQWVMESRINHSGTCVAILKARDFIQTTF